MPDWNIYSVKCYECGSELEFGYILDREDILIDVKPCQSCLDAAYDDGYEKGHQAGYDQAYEEIDDEI